MGSNLKQDEDVTIETYLDALSTTRRITHPFSVGSPRRPVAKTADEFEIVYNPETDSNHPYEKWRRNPVLKWLVTREIARYLDRKTFLAVSFREAIIHSIFLLLLTIITFGSFSIDKYYLHEAMDNLYIKHKFPIEHTDTPRMIDFYQINTYMKLWFYMEYIFPRIYRSFWYSKHDPQEIIESTDEYSHENRVIGSPQIRQKAVKNESCEEYTGNLTSVLNMFPKMCYKPYTDSDEDKANITQINLENTRMPFMDWSPPSETGSMPISGYLATYGGGGYVAIISRDRDKSQLLNFLQQDCWIRRSTRAVFIEFTIYNPNANLFMILKLIFEMPPTGGVVPSHWNYVKKLIRYNDTFDFIILFSEIVCTVFFVFFTIQKVLEIQTLKLKVFGLFWNYIDLMVIITSYLTLVFNILLYIDVNEEVPIFVAKKNENKYASFDWLLHLHILYSRSFAMLIGFTYLKLLKYLNIIHVMYELESAVTRAVRDIISYSILFFYLCFVFALVGLSLFGSKLEEFRTFPMAFYSLLRLSIGDFNYGKLEEAEPTLGPIFFYLFIFVMVFILASIFLAILVSRYKEIRSEVRIGGAKTFIGDMLKTWFLWILQRLDCQWVISQIEHKDFESKIKSPTESIRLYLRQAGYSELEIELFFKKYDITDSKIEAMDEDRISYRKGEREAPPPLSQRDIVLYIVIRKLEYLENHYNTASKLIDTFLKKLTKIEEASRRMSPPPPPPPPPPQ